MNAPHGTTNQSWYTTCVTKNPEKNQKTLKNQSHHNNFKLNIVDYTIKTQKSSLPNLVSRKDMISSLWSSNVFRRALLIWRCRSSSVGQICSNTAIFISSCNFTRFPDGSLRFSYREIRSNQISKFPVKSSSLDFAGLKRCLNSDPFRLPVAGSYRSLIFRQTSIELQSSSSPL